MNQCLTRLHKFRPSAFDSQLFRSGVSLHSHTMYSKEYLDRLPQYIDKFPIGGYIIERELGRLHLYHNWNFDFTRLYWTPPLSPREAYELEKQQICKDLLLTPLVSLTDHDNIEAGLHLRLLPETAQIPVSVEWTVPFENTAFHIGVHNLPSSQASEWMAQFRALTEGRKSSALGTILSELSNDPKVLIVLNHPYWDTKSIGSEAHRAGLRSFLQQHKDRIHALELNGMRSRRENREVVALGEEIALPVVAGGDRHGCKANTVLNVSAAQTFDEFVAEIRAEHKSEVLLMPQYFEPLQLRLLENAWDALSDAPGEFGRQHWMSRVFLIQNGEEKSLSCFNGTNFHKMVDKFRWVLQLVVSPAIRPAVRLPFLGNEEGGI
jgi:hypothetical protein